MTALIQTSTKVFSEETGIKNFVKVDDSYYRGAKLKKKDYVTLKNLGIKTIIDLREIYTDTAQIYSDRASEHGIKYYNIRLSPFFPPDRIRIVEFFNIINNKENQPVYVHCTYGQDRTGLMTALYRVEKYGWSYDEAYKEMLDLGFHPRLYFYHKQYLYKYIKKKDKDNNKNIDTSEKLDN